MSDRQSLRRDSLSQKIAGLLAGRHVWCSVLFNIMVMKLSMQARSQSRGPASYALCKASSWKISWLIGTYTLSLLVPNKACQIYVISMCCRKSAGFHVHTALDPSLRDQQNSIMTKMFVHRMRLHVRLGKSSQVSKHCRNRNRHDAHTGIPLKFVRKTWQIKQHISAHTLLELYVRTEIRSKRLQTNVTITTMRSA